ncbi:MAG TPA: hypothetical protein VHJ83_11385, partial [Micromonosporaceae bacterium]|nr:hypothetical protein [Micromonosporaceae bacterium]
MFRGSLEALTPRLRRWVIPVVLAGPAAVGISVVLATPPPNLSRLVTAVGLVAVAKTVTLRLRIGSERFMFAWGEAALVVSFGLLEPAWIVLAVTVGVLVSQVLTRASLVKLVYNSAGHGLAAAVAATVVVA